MAKTNTSTRTQKRRTGTKTTARRTSGKTAKGKGKAPVNAWRAGAKTLAAVIYTRGGDFWNELTANVERRIQADGTLAARRVAQVEPRATQH